MLWGHRVIFFWLARQAWKLYKRRRQSGASADSPA
jgi:hypothetical protein